MGYQTKTETASDFYERWHKNLSHSQAKTLENIKRACDAIEAIGPNNKMAPSNVGRYCQETLNLPPAEMTIRNMFVEMNGTKEHVYKNYIHKRNMEYTSHRAKPYTEKKAPSSPSYGDLVKTIKDSDTRSWVMDLIQRWQHAENSYNFIAKQIEHLSRESNGLDMAGAIIKGPSDDGQLSVIDATKPFSAMAEDIFSAIKNIIAIPENYDLPFLTLNHCGALVWDSGTGPVVILSPKQWDALKRCVKSIS